MRKSSFWKSLHTVTLGLVDTGATKESPAGIQSEEAKPCFSSCTPSFQGAAKPQSASVKVCPSPASPLPHLYPTSAPPLPHLCKFPLLLFLLLSLLISTSPCNSGESPQPQSLCSAPKHRPCQQWAQPSSAGSDILPLHRWWLDLESLCPSCS